MFGDLYQVTLPKDAASPDLFQLSSRLQKHQKAWASIAGRETKLTPDLAGQYVRINTELLHAVKVVRKPPKPHGKEWVQLNDLLQNSHVFLIALPEPPDVDDPNAPSPPSPPSAQSK